MPCNDALRVQQYFDNELDASASVEVERHLETCPECLELLADLEAIRGLRREGAPYYRASDELRDRIADALKREPDGRPIYRGFFRAHSKFFSGAASGAAAMALAASLVFFVMPSPAPDNMASDALNAHLRSMMSNHLVDVISSDQHTVKPWFAGHTDVSPPAVDFPKEGYDLAGGRADYVDGHRAAVVVYRHGSHIINVFSWAGDGERLPDIATRNGYHIVFWKSGDLDFCAVSDTALDELLELVRLMKTTTAAASRE